MCVCYFQIAFFCVLSKSLRHSVLAQTSAPWSPLTFSNTCRSVAFTWVSAVCSTVLKANFDIGPSLRSWQVEPSKGRSTQSCVFEGKYCQCFSGGDVEWWGNSSTAQVLVERSGPLALIRPKLPWNVPGRTSLRPGPLRQCFFFFYYYFTFIFSKTPPFLYFLLLYLFSLPPLWLLCMFLFLLQQTAVPAISVLDLVCSLRSLLVFLFRLHLCLLLFTTSLPSFGRGGSFTHGYYFERDVPLFQAGDTIMGTPSRDVHCASLGNCCFATISKNEPNESVRKDIIENTFLKLKLVISKPVSPYGLSIVVIIFKTSFHLPLAGEMVSPPNSLQINLQMLNFD